MNWIKKFVYRLRGEYTTEELIEMGMTVGKNFKRLNGVILDPSHCWLIEIGDNVTMAPRVHILCHDASTKQFLEYTKIGRVTIGNNVFIGMNAIITRGVTIGDNVIIGAGSVVTKDCEGDSVYAGNPARKIMSLSEFVKKREEKQIAEAKALALKYKEKFGKEPPVEIFSEYFTLFCTQADAEKVPKFVYQLRTGGNFDDTVSYMNTHPPVFENYNAFLDACFGRSNDNII